MRRAIYPGSFDPITNGHLNILDRACNMFDEIIILVAINPNKQSRFSVEERVEMVREAVKDYKNVKVDSYDGLTVKYAKEHQAIALIRGLRAVTDFEYEFQLASANAHISSDIESVFFMARGEQSFISSSAIMAMHENGVDISDLVPRSVVDKLKK